MVFEGRSDLTCSCSLSYGFTFYIFSQHSDSVYVFGCLAWSQFFWNHTKFQRNFIVVLEICFTGYLSGQSIPKEDDYKVIKSAT